jgi:hypothetical protein
MFPQVEVVGYDVTAGPAQVPRYDRTVVDDEVLGLVGESPRNLSRP